MLAASPGERLRTLRSLLGLTQGQLAVAANLPQSWISQVETSTREATLDGLKAIASATDTPLSFFDVRPSAVPLDSLRFRKKASASRIMTRRIHDFFGESYRIADTLLEEADYPRSSLPVTSAVSLTADDLEGLAAATRHALRIAPDKPIPHLTRTLERAGIAVAPFVLTDDPDEPPSSGGHSGVSYWGGPGSTALIGYFPGRHGDRERFTLAHEIGHLVLHTYRINVADAEAEANKFASALLVPKDRAEEMISEQRTLAELARIKATWGVSIQALIMRGVALDLIGDTRQRSLFVQLSSKGWRKEEPVTVGHENPLLLWTLLARRYGPRPYRQAADGLAIHPTVLRSIAPTPPSPSLDSEHEHGSTVRQHRSFNGHANRSSFMNNSAKS